MTRTTIVTRSAVPWLCGAESSAGNSMSGFPESKAIFPLHRLQLICTSLIFFYSQIYFCQSACHSSQCLKNPCFGFFKSDFATSALPEGCVIFGRMDASLHITWRFLLFFFVHSKQSSVNKFQYLSAGCHCVITDGKMARKFKNSNSKVQRRRILSFAFFSLSVSSVSSEIFLFYLQVSCRYLAVSR